MKILAIQTRMGIGDTVIFLPFIKALYKKYNSPISLLVKENSKADQYLYQTNYIDKIITLEKDDKSNDRNRALKLQSVDMLIETSAQSKDKLLRCDR